MTLHHFRDIPQGEAIRWQEWDEAAFRLAEREGKPILLTLTATWCHWCHVLDQTSYAYPQVIHLVNSRFVPVRVDVDRRPDISARYNQGGFPSVAILDAQGTLLAGRVYVPPEEMARLLEQVSAQYPELQRLGQRPGAAAAAQPTQPRSPDNSGTPAEGVLQRLQAIYDRDFGGFGLEPKQPPWEALRLLLALYSHGGDKRLLTMVCTTLDGMRTGLYDRKEQGFFRYAVSRDWQVPHYEKMLASNAHLGSVYLEAYQVTGRTRYRDTASGILTYLLRTLYDQARGLFYASQDAAEAYYRLPWKDREQAEKPRIDRTLYSGLNAVAASFLSQAYGVLGRPVYLDAASRVLEAVWSQGWEPEWGLRHIIDDPGRQPRLLADHLCTARACLNLYQVTGQPEQLSRAIELVRCIGELFGAADGGFYDVSAGLSPLDALLGRQQPVLENALLAEVLVTLSCLTGEGDYTESARRTLETFQEIVPSRSYLGPEGARRVEEDEEALFLPAGSAWGRAWDMLVGGPVHLVLVGSRSHPQTSGMLRTAWRVYAPHRVLQLVDPEQEADHLASLGFPPQPVPTLYVCMGGMCLAPITTPAGVRGLRTVRPWAVPHGGA